MFKTCTLSTINNKITPPPITNEINLQLHATDPEPNPPDPNTPESLSKKVSNPYDFSITHKKVRFRSLALAPEILNIIKVYGAEPWYNNSENDSEWVEHSKVKNLTIIDGGAQFELPRITSTINMFHYCKNLTSIDLSNFDISSVIDMSYMFFNCTSLKSIDLSNFDTSSVINMSYMFGLCTSLTTIDLSNFNTSNVTDMSSMFVDCFDLVTLDISNFDTSKVTTIHRMFYGCRSLKKIICPNGLDCSNVTDMGEVFHDCCVNLDLESPLHLKNVKSSLIESGSSPDDWTIRGIDGTRGVHYIVDSVI